MDVEEDDDDTHLCIRCKKTIAGLENYIIHRRQMCMYVETSNGSILNSSESSEHCNEKTRVVRLTANDFFSSLELQSKAHVTKNSFMESQSPESQKPLDTPVLSEQRLAANSEESCDVSHEEPDTQFDLSNSSEDCQNSFYPPRSHTGGKWKPGSRPDIATHFQWDIHSSPSSPVEEVGMFDDTVAKFNDSISSGANGNQPDIEKHSLQKQKVHNECVNKKAESNKSESLCITTSNKLKCVPCDKIFATKIELMVHVLSEAHKKRFDSIQQWYDAVFSHQETMVHSSPFQCLVCHYYFNNHEEFCSHFKTICHRQKAAQLKQSLLCVCCNFECRASDDLLSHVISREHHVVIHHVSQYHPTVVREKVSKYNCHYCINTCQMKKFKRGQEILSSLKRHGKLKSNGGNKSNESQNHQEKSSDFLPVSKQSNSNVALSDELSNVCCPHCDKLFAQNVDLQIHVQLNHSRKGHNCKLCNLTFHTTSSLEEHIKGYQHRQMLVKENAKGLKICKKIKQKVPTLSARKRFLSRQNKQCHKGFVKKYSCPYCNKFFSKTHLKYHVFTHTGEKPFKCHICNKCFAQKGTLSIHVKRHLGLKHLKCDKCDFRTFRKSVLQRHEETHKTNRVRDSLCEICGAAYLDQWALKQHMLSHNGCVYKCTYTGCHHAFRRPSELVYHMRVHTNERPYLCDICGYSGKTSHQLKKHQRSHTGERPFKCKHCDYSAALSSQLVRHMRLHTGSKPYKCPYCSYTCNAQGNIRKHILKTKKHAGKKMYPCKFCEFACNELQDYREHLLQRHRECFPNGESQIDSSVSGVYVKDIPDDREKLVPYSPRKKVSEHRKIQSKSILVNKEKGDSSKTEDTLHSSNKHQNMENAATTQKTLEAAATEISGKAKEGGQCESVLYIAIPSTSNICETSQSKNDKIVSKNVEMEYKKVEYKNGDIDTSQISVDDLIARTVSETYTYSNGIDELGAQVLISGGLDCVQTETSLADGSTLQLSNSAENNPENTIFIYLPFH